MTKLPCQSERPHPEAAERPVPPRSFRDRPERLTVQLKNSEHASGRHGPQVFLEESRLAMEHVPPNIACESECTFENLNWFEGTYIYSKPHIVVDRTPSFPLDLAF